MNYRHLLAALVAAITALACEQSTSAPSTSVEVVNPDQTKVATIAIEVKGQSEGSLNPRRLGPPTDEEYPTVSLYADADGSQVATTWTNSIAYAKVGVGNYTCKVEAKGYAPETSSIKVAEDDLDSTLNVTISLTANGPTKPKSVDLGQYSIEWVNTNSKYEPQDMWQKEKMTTSVTYSASYQNQPAQYTLQDWFPGATCSERDGSLTCDEHVDQQGDIAHMVGTVSGDQNLIEMNVDYTLYPGEVDEYHQYSMMRLTRL